MNALEILVLSDEKLTSSSTADSSIAGLNGEPPPLFTPSTISGTKEETSSRRDTIRNFNLYSISARDTDSTRVNNSRNRVSFIRESRQIYANIVKSVENFCTRVNFDRYDNLATNVYADSVKVAINNLV